MSTNSKTERSFIERQFGSETTIEQIAFDLGFGVAIPLICLWLDPIVFRPGFDGQPLAGSFAVGGIAAILIGIISLFAWLVFRRPASLFVGLLTGGAIFAGVLGFVMLPFTLLGLMAFIGILGFAPFVTSFVFLRNAVRANAITQQRQNSRPQFVLLSLGLFAALGFPITANLYVHQQISRGTEMVMSADAVEVGRGLAILKRMNWFVNVDQLVRSYETEKDHIRRQALASAYKELRGEDIETRLAILRD